MELREALTQIAEIRLQIARTEVFRGYRSATVGFSGLVAVAASVAQAIWIPQPVGNLLGYLVLWMSAAAIAGGVAAAEMLYRCLNARSPLARETTWLVLEQFLPGLMAGGAITCVLLAFAPETLWMLPGLWSIFFGMGIFASHRLLPRPVFWVAMFYLVAGLVALVMARGPWALSPLAMGIPFGVGQALASFILYWTLERGDVQSR